MGKVNIELVNGQLGGSIQTNDGVVGMMLTGNIEGDIPLYTPFTVSSFDNFKAKGFTEAINPFVYKEVKEFYNEAGAGAVLYLMLCANTDLVSDMTDNTRSDMAKRLLNFGAGKIKILGFMTNDNDVYGGGASIPNAINDDVYAAASNAKLLVNEYFNAKKPFRAIIGGTSYNGNPDDLTDMTAGTSNSQTAILIGDTKLAGVDSTKSAALGLLLGRIAAIPVMRKVSRVRTGSLSNTDVYLGADAFEDVPGDDVAIANKGFITFTTYPNVAGYFFSGDDTCSATNDDYHALAHGRVIDKAAILAYAVFVQEVDNEVPVVPGGTPDPGFAKNLEKTIIDQINLDMTSNQEIELVECFIDLTQDVIATEELGVVIGVRPVGYSKIINIKLGLAK